LISDPADGTGGINRDVVGEAELARTFAEASRHAMNLAVLAELDHAAGVPSAVWIASSRAEPFCLSQRNWNFDGLLRRIIHVLSA